jgi:hypothetical protein
METYMGTDEIDKVLGSIGLNMKPYGITVLVFEHSEGLVDQFVAFNEYSLTAPENVFKYQMISDAIIEALNGKNEVGSGGVVREMGEMFQAAAAAAGGDVKKAMAGFGAAALKHGQGKAKSKTK